MSQLPGETEIHWRGEFPQSLIHTIIENAGEGIWYLDRNNRIIAVNKKGGLIVGYTPEEMIGHSPVEYLTFADTEASGKKIVDKAGVHTLHKVLKKDGSTSLVISRTITLQDSDGTYNGALVYFIDVSETNKWDKPEKVTGTDLEDTKAERDLLLQILRMFPDEISIFDRELHYIYVNPAAASAIGHKPGEIIGRTSEELGINTEASVQIGEMIRSVFSSGAGSDAVEDVTSDGGLIKKYHHIMPVEGSDGTIAAVFLVSRYQSDM